MNAGIDAGQGQMVQGMNLDPGMYTDGGGGSCGGGGGGVGGITGLDLINAQRLRAALSQSATMGERNSNAAISSQLISGLDGRNALGVGPVGGGGMCAGAMGSGNRGGWPQPQVLAGQGCHVIQNMSTTRLGTVVRRGETWGDREGTLPQPQPQPQSDLLGQLRMNHATELAQQRQLQLRLQEQHIHQLQQQQRTDAGAARHTYPAGDAQFSHAKRARIGPAESKTHAATGGAAKGAINSISTP